VPLELDYDREALTAICRRYQIRCLELFGSHARGEAGPTSDIDVLVTFADGVELGLSYFAVPQALEDLFGRPVDMLERPVVERDRNPYFRRSVLGCVELLFAAE